MKSVDIIFGKRLDGSNYHISTQYVDRVECKNSDGMIRVALKYIPDILRKCEMDEEAITLLNRLLTSMKTLAENLPNDSGEIVNDINMIFAELSYIGYELYFIGRNDVTPDIEFDESIDHSYMMIKRLIHKPMHDINNFELGLCNAFDVPFSANTNSMMLEFFADNRFKFGTSEDEAMIGLDGILENYRMFSERKESAFMDTRKLLRIMEQLGFKFILTIAQ